MGKRPTNSTKHGKFMNPTDQARKVARKKELKKNKKQRQMIRVAVIKSRDPEKVFEDLKELDNLEYNPYEPPPFSASIILDKRRKLYSIVARIKSYYEKEDAAYFQKIKKMESYYLSYRAMKVRVYNEAKSVEASAATSIDEIPLPTNLTSSSSQSTSTANIKSILKNKATTPSSACPGRTVQHITTIKECNNMPKKEQCLSDLDSFLSSTRCKQPSAPPATSPPPLSPVRTSEPAPASCKKTFRVKENFHFNAKSSQPSHLQPQKEQFMKESALTDSNDFINENYEEVFAEDKSEISSTSEKKCKQKKITFLDEMNSTEGSTNKDYEDVAHSLVDIPLPNEGTDLDVAYGVSQFPQSQYFVNTNNNNAANASQTFAIGAPGFANTNMQQANPLHQQPRNSASSSSNAQQSGADADANASTLNQMFLFTAPPKPLNSQTLDRAPPLRQQLKLTPTDNLPASDELKNKKIIQAKPQLRSLTQEAIKFLPTSLLVKRNLGNKAKKNTPLHQQYVSSQKHLASLQQLANSSASKKKEVESMSAIQQMQSKDHAYEKFMEEMHRLL